MNEKTPRKAVRRRKTKADEDLPRHGNRSIIVAVSLMRIIASFGRPATLSEIAAAAGMSPTRTHRYLMGLVRTELLEQNPLTTRYDLGTQVIELGVAALGRVDAVRLGAEALIALTEKVRIASLMCSWGTHGPTVLRWEQADLTSAVRIREGRNLSLLHSASGQIFLAYLPASATDPLVNAELRAESQRASTRAFGRADVERLKSDVRTAGLAVSVGEEVSTFSAMSAPIFDANGKLALCLTLIGTVSGFDADLGGAPATALRETARALSRRLGWSDLSLEAPKPLSPRRGKVLAQ